MTPKMNQAKKEKICADARLLGIDAQPIESRPTVGIDAHGFARELVEKIAVVNGKKNSLGELRLRMRFAQNDKI